MKMTSEDGAFSLVLFFEQKFNHVANPKTEAPFFWSFIPVNFS